MAQALDVPIALLERRAALEAARQQYPSESGPTDADICVEEQVGILSGHVMICWHTGQIQKAAASSAQVIAKLRTQACLRCSSLQPART